MRSKKKKTAALSFQVSCSHPGLYARASKCLLDAMQRLPSDVLGWYSERRILWTFYPQDLHLNALCTNLKSAADKWDYTIDIYARFWAHDKKRRRWIIYHELAHAFLNHSWCDEEHDAAKYDRQEYSADLLADEWELTSHIGVSP